MDRSAANERKANAMLRVFFLLVFMTVLRIRAVAADSGLLMPLPPGVAPLEMDETMTDFERRCDMLRMLCAAEAAAEILAALMCESLSSPKRFRASDWATDRAACSAVGPCASKAIYLDTS